MEPASVWILIDHITQGSLLGPLVVLCVKQFVVVVEATNARVVCVLQTMGPILLYTVGRDVSLASILCKWKFEFVVFLNLNHCSVFTNKLHQSLQQPLSRFGRNKRLLRPRSRDQHDAWIKSFLLCWCLVWNRVQNHILDIHKTDFKRQECPSI